MTGQTTGRWTAAYVLIAAVAIALYARTIGFDLVFDDLSLIGPDGPRALGNGVLPYRPLRYLSYGLDAWLGALGGGGTPAAYYHATNVALHALAGVFVARLARRLGGSVGAALAAGLLFVTHPLAVEAVAYVSGRRDLLATVLGITALLLWTSPRGLGALAIVALLLAVATKESGGLFLGALVLASATGLGPPLERSAFTLGAAALAAVALPVAYGAVGPLAPSGPACAAAATVTRLASHYAWQVVLPFGLAVEYPDLAEASADCARLLDLGSLAGFALLGIAGGIVVAALRLPATETSSAPAGERLGWSSAALYMIALATVIGAHEPGADRHAYPLIAALSAALALSIASRLSRLDRRRGVVRALVTVATAIVVVTFAAATTRRVGVWRNELTLWSASVVDAPASGRAEHNLAGALLAAGDLDAAAAHVRRARSLGYAPALVGDAAIACARGRWHRGRDLLARARLLGVPPAELASIAAVCTEH